MIISKAQRDIDEKFQNGWRMEAPTPDIDVFDSEVIEKRTCCNRHMRYVPWTKDNLYEAWGVCDKCGKIVSF